MKLNLTCCLAVLGGVVAEPAAQGCQGAEAAGSHGPHGGRHPQASTASCALNPIYFEMNRDFAVSCLKTVCVIAPMPEYKCSGNCFVRLAWAVL